MSSHLLCPNCTLFPLNLVTLTLIYTIETTIFQVSIQLLYKWKLCYPVHIVVSFITVDLCGKFLVLYYRNTPCHLPLSAYIMTPTQAAIILNKYVQLKWDLHWKELYAKSQHNWLSMNPNSNKEMNMEAPVSAIT